MDFSWSQEQLAFKNALIEFARKELDDDLVQRDRCGAFSRDLWEKCADFGIQGLLTPTEYGGQGADVMTAILLMEALGYACRDNGLIFGMAAQMLSVQMPILTFGTETQKRKYLPRLCEGRWIGAHAMSEPDSGSDAFSLKTTAELQGGHYLLNGAKTFVTNAPMADVFLTFATVDKRYGFMGVTSFIVERDFPGVKVGKPMEKMGLRTTPLAEVVFEDCVVPVENRLGKAGNGAAIFRDSMEWERGCILANYVGGMERQLETCVAYAKERKQFNKPIGKFQSVANRLVDMKVRLETGRLMLYKAAWTKANGGQAAMDTAIAKLYLSEAWVQSCLDAIQVHGGYGYMAELEVERDLRDSVAGTLYSGTSEIQRNIIAGQLGL
jgi:alkylation response protein AidB-like acyl-CoA dehydrogenase